MNRADGLWIGMKLLGLYFLITGLAGLGHSISGSIGYYLIARDGGYGVYAEKLMLYESYRSVLMTAIEFIGGVVLLRMATLVIRKQHKAETKTKADETSATQP